MRDPIAVLSDLIDLLDKVRVTAFEDLQHTVEAAVLDLLFGVVHDLDDHRMAKPTLLVLDFGEDPVPDNGLEDGEENQNREVVKVFQAEIRARDDSLGLESLEFVVSAERAIPGQSIPMFPAESAEQLELGPGRNVPAPGVIEVDHFNKTLKASSNADRSKGCNLNPSCSMRLHRSSGSFSTRKIMNFCKPSVRSSARTPD